MQYDLLIGAVHVPVRDRKEIEPYKTNLGNHC